MSDKHTHDVSLLINKVQSRPESADASLEEVLGASRSLGCARCGVHLPTIRASHGDLVGGHSREVVPRAVFRVLVVGLHCLGVCMPRLFHDWLSFSNCEMRS